MADGSKIGRVSLVHLYDTDEVDVLVTDPSADPAMLEGLRDHGVEVPGGRPVSTGGDGETAGRNPLAARQAVAAQERAEA